jgi:hypothetical protein
MSQCMDSVNYLVDPKCHPIFVAFLQQPFESSLHAQVPSRLSKSPIIAILERRRVAVMNSFQCNQTLLIFSFLFGAW